MNEALVEEAESWLIQLHKDLSSDRGYEREPTLLYNRVAWEVKLLSPELQDAVKAVLAKWLKSNNIELIMDALRLILRLESIEFIPLIEQVYRQLAADPIASGTTAEMVKDDLNLLQRYKDSGLQKS
ncbi:MAG: hypothetical protein ABFD64_01625 [Armatimonadota bacterium]